MGVGPDQAISTRRSSHGPWHLSRTYATQLAMSNDWLAQQGLVSFKGSLGRVGSSAVNRLVRTRMPGEHGAPINARDSAR